MRPILEKEFEYKGYNCYVLMQPSGRRCGYVEIPKENKYFGVDYDEIDVECHGGLTYSRDYLSTQNKKHSWYIGFDCAHAWDSPDYKTAFKMFTDIGDNKAVEKLMFFKQLDDMHPIYDAKIRDLGYCVEECKCIVDQLLENE